MAGIPGFVTVRTTSSRLPQKCLMSFGDGNVLEHVIRRALTYGIDPIVCTSTEEADDIIENIANAEGVKCFRGSLHNKLKRWADCAEHFHLDAFHTIDADDPFFDPEEMADSMKLLEEGRYDMVAPTESSSSGGGTVGYSLATVLVKKVADSLPPETDTEMMWYHLEKVENLKSAVLPETRERPEKLRLTLDYEEDYWLLSSVCRIAGNYAPRKAIDELFMKNPDLYKINWFRNQEWQAGQLEKKI